MKKLSMKLRILAMITAAIMLLGMTPAFAANDPYSAVVTAKTISVFSDPAMTDRAGSLKKGSVVVVEEVSGKTASVSYNGVGGYYCSVEGITDVLEIGKPAVTTKEARAYAKPDKDSKYTTVGKGYEVTVLAVDSTWALIEAEGYGLYMYKSCLSLVEENLSTPMPENTAAPDSKDSIDCTVTASTLNIYKSANADSDKLGTLSLGDRVSVHVYNSSWAYISYNGIYGYVKTAGLIKTSMLPEEEITPEPDEEESFAAIVSVSSAKVYESASTDSKVIATLKNGAEINVLDYNSTWAHVEKNGNTGYIKTSALTRADAAPTPAPDTSRAFPAVVSVSSAKVYTAPSTGASVMTTLKKGAELNVLEYNSTWACVEKNGYYGYIKTSSLEKVEPRNLAEEYRAKYPDIQFTATVICDDAPVYVDKDTSKASAQLDIGKEVDVYAYSKNWAYIGIGTTRGFIAVKYLSNAQYTALGSGDSGENVLKLQNTLVELGYYDGIPDGTYGNLSSTAVRRFQSALGISETGTADVATLRVLYGGYAPECSLMNTGLSFGSAGDAVTRIQTRLYYLGYFTKPSSIDGSFGNTTITAVKLFQDQADLNVSGQADAATVRALYNASAPKLPSGTTAADYTPSSSTNTAVLKVPDALVSTQVTLPDNATREEKIEYIIYLAQCQLGKPYIYATAGPDSYDCSGLTVYLYRKLGISLGRSAYAQGYNSSTGTKISSVSDLKRGDIVCFDTLTDSDISDHVGLYIGNGYFIHASSGDSNGHQVCVSQLNSGYYSRVFSWGRRPLD